MQWNTSLRCVYSADDCVLCIKVVFMTALLVKKMQL